MSSERTRRTEEEVRLSKRDNKVKLNVTEKNCSGDGMRGRMEKDFDDKYLITAFHWLVLRDELLIINHGRFLFKAAISTL